MLATDTCRQRIRIGACTASSKCMGEGGTRMGGARMLLLCVMLLPYLGL